MSSKQIKLLCLILGCATLIMLAGVMYPGLKYAMIVKDYGIDAPFEDWSNNPLLVRVLYDINHLHELILR